MKKGSRLVSGYAFLGLLIFMTACSLRAEDKHLTREEAVIAKTIKQAESVDSYAIEVGILDDIAWGDGTKKYTYSMISGTEALESRRGYSEIVEVEGNEETETTVFNKEIYESEDEIYVNVDHEGWKIPSDPESYEYEETEYEGAIRFLENIENVEDIIIEENEKTFEITFPEMAEVLYEFYAQVLSVMESDAFVETGVPEAFIKIDKEDYSVREFTTKFFYDARTGSTSERVVTIEFRFDDINEIEDIKIPDEVIEEAEANE
ncbi:DUF6612 family protein [Shouchella clausii]|jgi:hypothetical protein|uniref:DUF6612 family protein n=1 Tax=Shouchella clausii TaxID=79880 RepID=UPI0022A98151|nr:DUF6612 family protein [Shouchella clausii]MCZ1182593.1 hypothetical protein [Shouchella clausii]MDO7266678.1 hypothetical protein [Shouchella clausii]MDO7286407.1 hypothetical protein [Shouchella clausii]